MMRLSRLLAATLAVGFSLSVSTASAMTLREFRKFSNSEQGMYIGAAVSMLAYTYAANGDVAKGRCVQNWYFGQRGAETPGPREITNKLDAYDSLDPDKYHVEGVILGVTDKVCGNASATSKPKP